MLSSELTPFLDKVFRADALEAVSRLPDDSVNLVVTSPPYAKRRKSYAGIEPERYATWLFGITSEIMRVLTPDGSLVLNIKENAKDGVRMGYALEWLMMMRNNYRHAETFVWHKINPYPSGSPDRLKDGFEYLYQFTKSRAYKFYPDRVLVPSQSKYLASEKRRSNKGRHDSGNGSSLKMKTRCADREMVRPSNVIMCSPSNRSVNHEAKFPPDIPRFFIKLMTDEGDVVLDPFVGALTTTDEAFNLNRRFIGVDLHPVASGLFHTVEVLP